MIEPTLWEVRFYKGEINNENCIYSNTFRGSRDAADDWAQKEALIVTDENELPFTVIYVIEKTDPLYYERD